MNETPAAEEYTAADITVDIHDRRLGPHVLVRESCVSDREIEDAVERTAPDFEIDFASLQRVDADLIRYRLVRG